MNRQHIEYGLAALVVVLIVAIMIWAFASSPTGGGASVVVQTTPGRASVYLDGRFIGTTPLTRAEIPVGPHVLRVTKFGCRPLLRELNLAKGTNSVKLELTELVGGTLSIASDPPEAEVVVDGELRGVTPLVIKNIGPGGHPVRVSLVNYVDWVGTTEIEEGKTSELKLTLNTRTETHYLEAIKLNPKDAALQCDLAHYYIVRSEWKKAEDALAQSLILTATEGESAYYQGRLFQEIDKIYKSQFKYDDVPRGQQVVVDALARAVKACPTNVPYYSLAFGYAAERGSSERAQEIIETGLVAFPYDHNWAVSALQRRLQEGNLDRTIEQLSARLKQNPNDFSTRFQRVTLMRQRGTTDGMIEDYEELAKGAKSPAAKGKLLEEAARMWERKHDLEKAADAYSRAVAVEPTNKDKAPVYYTLVRILTELKRNDQASEVWKQAVACQETVESACRWRLEWAQFELNIEKPDRAKAVLNDVLKLSKNDQTRTRAKDLLDKLNSP